MRSPLRRALRDARPEVQARRTAKGTVPNPPAPRHEPKSAPTPKRRAQRLAKLRRASVGSSYSFNQSGNGTRS